MTEIRKDTRWSWLHTKAVPAFVGSAILVLAACGSTTTSPSNGSGSSSGTSYPGAFGSIPAESGTPTAGGTVSYAEQPGAGPNYIFPITPSANSTVFDIYQFQYLSWRPLYWSPQGATPEVDPALSLAAAPKYSNGNKTVTIDMKQNNTWSNGTAVDANDVVFAIDLIEAAVKESPANFGNYTPGFFPDNVTSAVATSKYVVTLTLNKAYNPGWFYDDQLDLVVPLPSTQWDVTSVGGPQVDYTNPANAKAIYDFLNAQSMDLSTYATNPLWKDVDGPYTLNSYTPANNAASFTANTKYTINKPEITTVDLVPFTSTSAEFTQLLSGSLDVGYVDPTDLPQVNRLKALGYSVFGYPDYGFEYMPFNFDDTTGDWNNIISQLYVREALQSLVNEPGDIKGIFDNAAVQSYGVVPQYPSSPYQPANAVTPAYPYSTSKATQLLTSHGWKVENGVMTCESAGTGSSDCGASIPKGTTLSFNLVYGSSPANIGQQVVDFVSSAKKVGINISTSEQSFDTVLTDENDVSAPTYDNKWAMANFGGFTNSIYPTTNTLFNTTGSYNLGAYNSSEANTLIHDSVYGGNASAVKNELSYIDTSFPGLWEAQPDEIYAWKTDIQGPSSSFATMTQYFFDPEEWYIKS